MVPVTHIGKMKMEILGILHKAHVIKLKNRKIAEDAAGRVLMGNVQVAN